VTAGVSLSGCEGPLLPRTPAYMLDQQGHAPAGPGYTASHIAVLFDQQNRVGIHKGHHANKCLLYTNIVSQQLQAIAYTNLSH